MENCIVNTTGKEAFERQNQQLADDFLQNYFYKRWHKDYTELDKPELELIISPKCNLGCKYCYIHKHRKDIFDKDIFNEELTLKNLTLVLKWLEKNQFNPNIEIFSGELFAQEIGYKVMDAILLHEQNIASEIRPQMITIPTNFTFLNSDELSKKIEYYVKSFQELGIRLCLSASFDGKYMEVNRPFVRVLDYDINQTREDEYYDKAFKYCKDNNCGLHPMIYSKNIEQWKDNFLWFQEMMEKHGIPWEHLYLLHVRNEEWTTENIQEFANFLDFLYEWTFNKLDRDPKKLVDFMIKGDGFNILSSCLSRIGRGLSCGIQTGFPIRLSDLMVYPCHRTGYSHYYEGQFVEDNEQILKYHNYNAELLITIYSMTMKHMATCATCPINNLCMGQCLGACHESNNSLFTPIPSVCAVHYMLVVTTIKNLVKYNAYDYALSFLNIEKIIQLDYVKKELGL